MCRSMCTACPCCKNYLVTARKPAQPLEKSIVSPGLLAHIATQKYVDALPLYRQTEIFKRIGVEMDRTTLATWMIRCGNLVQPFINLLHEKMLEQTILHADETRVQVLNETDRAAETQSFMWVLRSTNRLVRRCSTTTNRHVAARCLWSCCVILVAHL